MSEVTLAVFCTLLGLLPLCKNAKFDGSPSEFRLFDVPVGSIDALFTIRSWRRIPAKTVEVNGEYPAK